MWPIAAAIAIALAIESFLVIIKDLIIGED
jgi:hypothetical protein